VIKEKAKSGFTYLVEVINKDGAVVDSETVKNLMPVEGINHMLGVTMKQAAQVATWYVGLYEGAYTPQSTDLASTFPGLATEATAYDEAARVALVSGPVAGGVVSNTGDRAEFTFNATKSIAGGFISSTSTKGGTTGVLLSAVRFSSPKAVENGFILRITAGLQIISA
jgi:hypothetical protein